MNTLPMNTSSMNKRQAGLTLVEIIVAVGVFSIIMLALSGTIIQGLQVRRNNSAESQALAYAASVLEQYKNAWADFENFKCFNSDPAEVRRNISTCTAASYEPLIPAVPTGFKPDFIAFACLERDGDSIANATCNGNDDAFAPDLRRVTIILKDQQDKIRAQLSTEIGNPIPQR